MEQLKLEQVDIGYGGQPLIQKIDLSFLQGKMSCILGSNGAGKTTLLKTIARIIKPLGGVIRFGGEDVRQINGVRYAKEVSAVLTDRISLENCTVWDVAAMGRNPHTGFFGLLAEEDRRRVRESLEACDAWELRNRLFNQLSDGQKQKVLIARGLCQSTPVLLLDEPTSHLDIFYKMEVLQTLRTQCVQEGKTVICTLHEPDLAVKCCDRLILVKGDRILACGDTGDIVQSSAIEELYGFSGRQFDPVMGLVEFPAAKGEDVFFAGADENTVYLFRELNRRQKGFAAGVLHQNDLLFALGRAMGVSMVTQKPYLPVTPEQSEQAFSQAMDYGLIVAADLPEGDFQAENRALVRKLAAAGKKVVSTSEYRALLESKTPIGKELPDEQGRSGIAVRRDCRRT